MHSSNPGAPGDTSAASFETTHWSEVVAAGGGASPQSAQALARLCECYWPPLYSYVRRRGYPVEAAQDLTQEFFARLLEKKALSAADRERGKFRCFLLASMKHFLANEWDRSRAYFAMELVCGPADARAPSLVEFAEQHKLNTRQRLELLTKVADAAYRGPYHSHARFKRGNHFTANAVVTVTR
jgi:DNA-directed RNA polymerase specialized sigma24 family protein